MTLYPYKCKHCDEGTLPDGMACTSYQFYTSCNGTGYVHLEIEDAIRLGYEKDYKRACDRLIHGAGVEYTDAEDVCRYYGLKPPAPLASAAE